MERIIQQMKSRGVEFLPGMKESDFLTILQLYQISFPAELSTFFSYGIPYDRNDREGRFPIWNDFSKSNVEKIAERIREPVNRLTEDMDTTERKQGGCDAVHDK